MRLGIVQLRGNERIELTLNICNADTGIVPAFIEYRNLSIVARSIDVTNVVARCIEGILRRIEAA